MFTPLVALLITGASQDADEIVFPGAFVAQQIEATLKGTEMVFSADSIDSNGLNRQGSYIKLGSSLQSKKWDFTLPVKKVDLGYLGDVTYKINDVRMNGFKVTSDKKAYLIAATFESEGVEMKGIHSNLGDAGAPDVELDKPRLELRLRPTVTKDGKVSYSDPEVKFTAKVDNTAIPRFTAFGYDVDLVNLCSDYRTRLCSSIADKIEEFLNDPRRKGSFENVLSEFLPPMLSGATLRFNGTDLCIKPRSAPSSD